MYLFVMYLFPSSYFSMPLNVLNALIYLKRKVNPTHRRILHIFNRIRHSDISLALALITPQHLLVASERDYH